MTSRAAIAIVLFSAALCTAQPASSEAAAIATAAKSPQALARFVESHPGFDWDTLWKALGVRDPGMTLPPCEDRHEKPCSTQIETISNPNQVILILKGDQPQSDDVYLRYMQKPNGGWQFAGVCVVDIRYDVQRHEIARIWNKPILKIWNDQSQIGSGITQQVEEWFDLTQPGLEPVFSFTVEGGLNGWSMAVSRGIDATFVPRQESGTETIEVILTVHFAGIGLDLETTFNAVYARRNPKGTFTLQQAYSGSDRRRPISLKDSEELADTEGGPSEERLLAYAFDGLQKIATGTDPEARQWLQSVLDHANDTPEKRTLLDLLKKRE